MVLQRNPKDTQTWQAVAVSVQLEGKIAWTADLPDTYSKATPTLITNSGNGLGLIIFDSRYLIAISPVDGEVAWTYAILEPNYYIAKIAAFGNRVYLLAEQTDVQVDPTLMWTPPKPTNIISIDTGITADIGESNYIGGVEKWRKVAMGGLDGVEGAVNAMSADRSLSGALVQLAAGSTGAFFTYGNLVTCFSYEDGSTLWSEKISLVSSGGLATGAAANITHVTVGEYPGLAPHLLLTSYNWGFQRFTVMVLNGTAPVIAWRTRFPDTALSSGDISTTFPALDPTEPMFFFNANRTSWATGKPIQQLLVVSIRLTDGSSRWSTEVPLPIVAPTAYGSRVYVVTTDGLKVMGAGGGAIEWGIDEKPVLSDVNYRVSGVFSDYAGQIGVMRCLGNNNPSTLCGYSGFMARDAALMGSRPTAGLVVGSMGLLAAFCWGLI
jgi:hypothetical protein